MSVGFESSDLYARWYHKMVVGEPNDMVIAVTASSRTGVSGTGKSTLLTFLAQKFDLTDGGFDAEQKATLDTGELAYDVMPEVEPRSAVVGDEMQGAPGTVGMDARRAMKQEVIDSINAILANRNKQFTVLLGAQTLQMLDPRLYPLIDAWLLIRRGPDQYDGPLGTHHMLYVEDYDLKNPTIKTPALEDFTWPRISHEDEDYRILERKKEEAKTEQSDDEDEEEDTEIPKEVQMQIAQEYRNLGRSVKWIADNVDSITYSHNWINENTETPDDKKRRSTA